MINVCSAAANKILKRLSDEKDLLLSTESQGTTYTVYLSEDKEDAIIPEYNFMDTQAKLEKIENKILIVKHAINKFNTETEVLPGITIDMALVKMAMLNKRLSTLNRFRKIQKVANGSGMLRGEAYRTYANFDHDEINAKYEAMSKELNDLQLALDRANMVNSFNIDIDE